jgi:hypothetical protein
MSPRWTVDLHKTPKLCFEGERAWKRGLGCWRQLTSRLAGQVQAYARLFQKADCWGLRKPLKTDDRKR